MGKNKRTRGGDDQGAGGSQQQSHQQGQQQRPHQGQQQQGQQQRPQQGHQQQGQQQRPQQGQQQQGQQQRPHQGQQQQGQQQRPQQGHQQQRPQQGQQQQGQQQRPHQGQQQQGQQQRPQQGQKQQGQQQRPHQGQQQQRPHEGQQRQGQQQRPHQGQQQRPHQGQQQQGQQQRPHQGQQQWPPQGQQQQGQQQMQQSQQQQPQYGQLQWPQPGQQQRSKQHGQQQQPQYGQQQPQYGQQQPQYGQQQPQYGQQQPQQSGQQAQKQSPSSRSEKMPPMEGPSQKLDTITSSTQVMSISKRVTPGQKGRKIFIDTNHLRIDLGKLTTAYHYDVEIDPDRPKSMLRDVVNKMREKHFAKNYPAFDGKKNLYSPIEFIERTKVLRDEIIIFDKTSEREKTFKVQIKFANEVDLRPLHNILDKVNNGTASELSPQEAIQCVEIVLRSAPSMTAIQAGRSFFFRPQEMLDLSEGMEMYSGFYQSVIRGWKPLLNVDVAHKAFPKEMSVVDAVREVCSSYRETIRDEDLRTRGITDYHVKTFSKFMYNLRVLYEIPNQPGSKREYRVNGLDQCPRNKRFQLDNGPEITIEQYYNTKKSYKLKYPLLPTLWVGSKQRKDKILLAPELCKIIAGQAVNRKMTEGQTSAMIKFAATSTDVRRAKIMKALSSTRHNDDMTVNQFGFKIGTDFEKVQARVLQPPDLSYTAKVVHPAKGVWNNGQFLKGGQINVWTIISACGQVENLQNLANMIYSSGSQCGINITQKALPPTILPGRMANRRDIEAALRKQKYDLVFVVIPDSGPTYSDVKKVAELTLGCITQCICKKTLTRRLNASTVNNILLKVNSKMNGTNHRLHITPSVLKRPCMIMGADVTHPSPDSQNIPSVVAVTASFDMHAFRYNICCRLQNPRLEVIQDLKAITHEQLMFFYRSNNSMKPEHIIFFRDGVSEGQFEEIRRVELQAVRSACTQVQADYQPKITFLVVQKRHHTRFFPKKNDSEDRNNNVPAGTCVDTDITNPMMQDFYLVSHASIQGVAKPTKYCTLWDDKDMSNDEIEELTYHLCHMFARCNRSVSYPAPTYYAHLAAARAKVYIENERIMLNDLEKEQRKIDIKPCVRLESPMFFV